MCKHPTCNNGICRRPLTKKPRKPLNKVSKKQVTRNRQYGIQNRVFKKMNPYCAVKAEGCTILTTESHHPGGRVGKRLLDFTRMVPCCKNCHDKCENEPEWAKENGFSESRLSKHVHLEIISDKTTGMVSFDGEPTPEIIEAVKKVMDLVYDKSVNKSA